MSDLSTKKYRQLLLDRANMLEQKRLAMKPDRLVLTEVITESRVSLDSPSEGRSRSREALVRQLFREDHLQSVFEQLDEVRGALQRLQAGEYGACLACGSVIDAGRLQLVPEARHCLSCQQLQDSGAELPR